MVSVLLRYVGELADTPRTLVSSYVPAMYIPSAGEPRSLDPPVRYLSSSSALSSPALRSYDAPNYVTGVAGAFLSAVSAADMVRLTS